MHFRKNARSHMRCNESENARVEAEDAFRRRPVRQVFEQQPALAFHRTDCRVRQAAIAKFQLYREENQRRCLVLRKYCISLSSYIVNVTPNSAAPLKYLIH